MAPRDKVEFVILRMQFIPYVHPLYPRIMLIRKRHSPAGSITQVRDWFDRAMSFEKSHLPPNIQIRYCEWRIQSGNASIFTIDGHRYEKVLIIMGEECVHWTFYQSLPMHRRIEGSGSLPVSYCGCCLNMQYLKIIETVKQNLTKRRG